MLEKRRSKEGNHGNNLDRSAEIHGTAFKGGKGIMLKNCEYFLSMHKVLSRKMPSY